MNEKLSFWTCLGILVGISCPITIANRLLTKNLPTELLDNYSLILSIACFIAFLISFFLTDLFVKNRKQLIWLIALYGFSFILPLLLETMDKRFIAEGHRILVSVSSFLGVLTYSFYGIIFYLGLDWFNKQKRTKELEQQNLQSELTLLKHQINPHFLFNTLNNIDRLVKSNPDQASATIIELSGMMRYMIYETNTNKVPLQKELDYIENFLELQKLQYANQELVEYTLTGNPEKKQVAPMIFIAFIENAFKHCTNKDIKHAIRTMICIEPDHIDFEVINYDGGEVISKDSASGIGLDAVRRRLNLLYPDRHRLFIQRKNDLFCVSLTIQLND